MNNLFETYSYGATESEKKIGVPRCLRITKMPLKMRKSNFQIKNSIFFSVEWNISNWLVRIVEPKEKWQAKRVF